MSIELLDTINNIDDSGEETGQVINIYGDSEIVNVEGKMKLPDLALLTVTLKDRYFIDPARFTLKRDTRNDYQFNSATDMGWVDRPSSTFKHAGVTYTYSINELRLGLDSNTTRIEIVINPNNIALKPDLPPEKTPISFKESWVPYVEDGRISLKVDGTPLQVTESEPKVFTKVDGNKSDPHTIQIVNNQIESIFNVEYFTDYYNFVSSRYDPATGSYVSVDTAPHTLKEDLIEWNITKDNWDQYMISYPGEFWTVDLPNSSDDMFIARPQQPVEDYPFIQIYKVDDSSLLELSREVTETQGTEQDLTGYVSDLVRIPYHVETEQESTPIQLKNKAMTSKGYQVLNYLQNIHLGSIMCSHEMLTGIGYKNIEFNLFVPNFKPISLDVAKVIDRNIDLDLTIDLTTGYGTLNLKLDGIVFHVEQEEIAKDIPFKPDDLNISLNSGVLNTDFLNSYLEIIVLNPDNAINVRDMNQRNITHSSYKYVKSDKMMFKNVDVTLEESRELESLLRKGVFVNGKN